MTLTAWPARDTDRKMVRLWRVEKLNTLQIAQELKLEEYEVDSRLHYLLRSPSFADWQE